MREMDLIPAHYRQNQMTKKNIYRFGALYVVLIVCLITGKLFLNSKVSKVTDQISILQQQQQSYDAQVTLISDLKSDRDAVQNQLVFVEMLQQGGGVDRIFLVFDRVMNNTVWLEDWKYIAGKLSAEKGDQAQPMKIIIRGKAVDHEALSEFVERLMSQSEIKDVRVINSTMLGEHAIVSFDMEIS